MASFARSASNPASSHPGISGCRWPAWPARRQRPGFTLVELVVAISVLGILLVLLLPAVQSARESGRRAQCTSRLRSLGLALRGHLAAKMRFPPAYSSQPPRHSVISHLLPFLDQGGRYAALDMSRNWNHPANAEHTRQHLGGVLLCPSAPGGRAGYHVSDYTCATKVNYARVARPLVKAGRIQDRGPDAYPNWHGLLQPIDGPQGRPVYAESVRDGLSSTLVFVEDAGRPFLYRSGRAIGATGTDYRWANWQMTIVIDRYCQQTQLINCDNGSEIYSFHIGGCNFAFGDASVRFLTDRIDPDLFLAHLTAAAQDLVPK